MDHYFHLIVSSCCCTHSLVCVSPVPCTMAQHSFSHSLLRFLIDAQWNLVSDFPWQSRSFSNWDVVFTLQGSTTLIVVISVVCVFVPTGWNSGGVGDEVTNGHHTELRDIKAGCG